MINWHIIDSIKNGTIKYRAGDEVQVFRRKKNGYPKGLEDDVTYYVLEDNGDTVTISKNRAEHLKKFATSFKRIHKTFLINKAALRDIKIKLILK